MWFGIKYHKTTCIKKCNTAVAGYPAIKSWAVAGTNTKKEGIIGIMAIIPEKNAGR